MRITQNTTANNTIYNLQQAAAKISQLSDLTASGQNVNTPSDDPIAAKLLVDIGDKLKLNSQYDSNMSKATTWLNYTSTVVTGISDIINQANKVAGTINSGSSDPTLRQSVHDQLVDLKSQIVDMANTQYGDQYIFGGANNTIPAFISKQGDLASGSNTVSNADVTGLKAGMKVSGIGIPAGATIGTVDGTSNSFTLVDSTGAPVNATATATGSSLNIYAGDSTQLGIEINQNSTISLNITGDRLLTGSGSSPSYGSTDILTTVDNLIAAVGDSSTASNVGGITTGITALQSGAEQLNNATSDILSRTTRLSNLTTLNDNNKNTLLSVVSSVQTVDYNALGVELSQQQTAYSAALASTAKVQGMSLLNYLPIG